MIKYKTIGPGGFAGAILLTLLLTALLYFTGGFNVIEGNLGVCLPSPDLWNIPREWSWGINLALVIVCGVGLIFFNKAYSVIQTADMVLPSMFLVLTACTPWAGGPLGSSSLMAVINLICLSAIFACYKSRNATQQVFTVATMLSVGSMFQYAFIFLMPGYILIGLMMKCFRIKEFIAFILGIAAPYWIAIGMGLIPLEAFHLPSFSTLFDKVTPGSELLIGCVTLGFTALVGVIMALNNAVKLYAGNSQRRLYNNAIAVLGLICVAGMILDFNNLPTYLATFFITIAVQIANTFALWNIRRGHLWLWGITVIYVTIFLVMAL